MITYHLPIKAGSIVDSGCIKKRVDQEIKQRINAIRANFALTSGVTNDAHCF
jgi:hypothetical protein